MDVSECWRGKDCAAVECVMKRCACAATRSISVDFSNRGLALQADGTPVKVDLHAYVAATIADAAAQQRAQNRGAPVDVLIKSLNLAGNGITPACMDSVVTTLREHPETALLRLSDNNLTDDGVHKLAEGIAGAARAATVVDGEPLGLTMLDLSRNGIRSTGCYMLADVVIRNGSLVTPRLDTLILAGNPIGDSGARALARAITDAITTTAGQLAISPVLALKLRHLDVFGCNWSESGASALQAAEASAQRAGVPLRITGLSSAPDTSQHHVRALSPKRSRDDLSSRDATSPPGIETPPLKTTWSFRRTVEDTASSSAFSAENGAAASVVVSTPMHPAVAAPLEAIHEDDESGGRAAHESFSQPTTAEQVAAAVAPGESGAVVELFHQYVTSQVEAAVSDRTAALEDLVRTMQSELDTLRSGASTTSSKSGGAPAAVQPSGRAASPRTTGSVRVRALAPSTAATAQPAAAAHGRDTNASVGKLVPAASAQDVWASSLRGAGSAAPRASSPRKGADASTGHVIAAAAQTARSASPRKGGVAAPAPTNVRTARAPAVTQRSPNTTATRGRTAGVAAANATRQAALRRMHTLADVDTDAVLVDADDLEASDDLLLVTDPKAWSALSPAVQPAATAAPPKVSFAQPPQPTATAPYTRSPAKPAEVVATAPPPIAIGGMPAIPGPFTASVSPLAQGAVKGLPPPPPSFYGALPEVAPLPLAPEPVPVEPTEPLRTASPSRADTRSVATSAAGRSSSPRHARPFTTAGNSDPLGRGAVLPGSSMVRRGHTSIADVANVIHAQSSGRRSPARSPSRISLQRPVSPRRAGGSGGSSLPHAPSFSPSDIVGATPGSLLKRFGSIRKPDNMADEVVNVDTLARQQAVEVTYPAATSHQSVLTATDLRLLQRMQSHALNVLQSTSVALGERYDSIPQAPAATSHEPDAAPDTARSAQGKKSRPELLVRIGDEPSPPHPPHSVSFATDVGRHTREADAAAQLYHTASRAYMDRMDSAPRLVAEQGRSPRGSTMSRLPSFAGSVSGASTAVPTGAGRISPKGAPPPSNAFTASILHTYDHAHAGAAASKAMQVWSASLRSSYDPAKPLTQEDVDAHAQARLMRVRSRSPSMRNMKDALPSVPSRQRLAPRASGYMESAARIVAAADFAMKLSQANDPAGKVAPASPPAPAPAPAHAPAHAHTSSPARSHTPPNSAYDAIKAAAIQQIARTPLSATGSESAWSRQFMTPDRLDDKDTGDVTSHVPDGQVIDTGVVLASSSESGDESGAALAAAAAAVQAANLAASDSESAPAM